MARVEQNHLEMTLLYIFLEKEPHTYEEDVTSSHGRLWNKVINIEIDSILQNHMCEVVDLPLCCKF